MRRPAHRDGLESLRQRLEFARGEPDARHLPLERVVGTEERKKRSAHGVGKAREARVLRRGQAELGKRRAHARHPAAIAALDPVERAGLGHLGPEQLLGKLCDLPIERRDGKRRGLGPPLARQFFGKGLGFGRARRSRGGDAAGDLVAGPHGLGRSQRGERRLALLERHLPPRQIRQRPFDPLLIEELDRFQPLDLGEQGAHFLVVGAHLRHLPVGEQAQRVVAEQDVDRGRPRPGRKQHNRRNGQNRARTPPRLAVRSGGRVGAGMGMKMIAGETPLERNSRHERTRPHSRLRPPGRWTMAHHG